MKVLRTVAMIAAGVALIGSGIFGAVVEEGTSRPWCFYLGAGNHPFSPFRGEIPPYQLTEIGGHVTPVVDIEATLGRAYIDDPKRDAVALIAAMRHVTYPHIAGGCAIGGDCMLYTVERDGIGIDLLASFPEREGERLDASLPPHRRVGISTYVTDAG